MADTDIKKVIKGIEFCIRQGETRGPCSPECPYEAIEPDCWIVMNKDVLELLKEQQPKEPMQLKYSETREEYWFYESICPKCGNRWISNGTDHFCPACGQPVFEPCEEEQKDGEQE